MKNLVIDTNTLIQIISSKSPYHSIYESICDGSYSLCVTTEILNEYEEILLRLTRPSTAKAVINAIIENPFTKLITSYFKFGLITSDPDDNKFVDCAIASNAKFLVTEDRHFDILHEITFPHVDIIGIDDFMTILMNESER